MLTDGDQLFHKVMKPIKRMMFLDAAQYRNLAYGNTALETTVDGYQVTVRSNGDGQWFVKGQLVSAVRAQIRITAAKRRELNRKAVSITEWRAMAAKVGL